ncbi:MAG TPA: hypothetical protein VF056_05505 [Thermoleophilaceae bacterium]
MTLLDRYEEELLEAARRLRNEPARRARARRALGRAGGGLVWVPAVVLVGLAVAISTLFMTGRGERKEADPARLVGWYASPVGSGQQLPKGAPQGSTLRLQGDGRYRLTTDVYRVSGRYRLRGETLALVSARRYEFLPTFRTSMVRLPHAPQCHTALGLYRLIERRDSITFRLTRDACGPRARVLSRAAWLRAGG